MKIVLSLGCVFLLSPFALSAANADAVRLKIVGPDGKPLAGAQIRIVEDSGPWQERKVEAPLDLSSDAAGTASFDSKNSLAPPPKTEARTPVNIVVARVVVAGMVLVSQQLVAGDNEIRLQPGQIWGGVVFDEAQKPVTGAKIVLSGFEAAEGERGSYFRKELQLETLSAADGSWNFAGLPRTGSARIAVQDPRFARETLNFSLLAPAAPPLFLERGAALKGRLLAPDGTPAAGVPLFPGSSGYYSLDDDNRTDAEGKFEFSSLRAGDYYLQQGGFRARQSFPFIIVPKSVKSLRPGEIRDLGDWKTEAGIEVKGKIVAGEDKKPLDEASISLWGRGNAQGTSDKNGEFSFRAPEDASQLSVSARGFTAQQKPLPAVVKGVLDLGTIELKRGIEAKGTVKDEQGRGVAGLQVYAKTAQGAREYGYTDDKGNFTFDAIPPGAYSLIIEGAKLVAETKFTIVENQKIAPIEATVATLRAESVKKLAGRALDGEGKPVAGAKISLRISNPGRSYQTVTTVSGVDGHFEAQFSLENATPKVGEAKRPGLMFVRAGEFQIVDKVWQADLFFQARGTALRGRVVDAEGKPIARAYVSLAGRNDQPIVQSDAEGAFVLPDVALTGVTLVASNGREIGETVVAKAGDATEIKLVAAAPANAAPANAAPANAAPANAAPADTAQEATALADEILPTARLGNLYGERWDEVWNALGEARLEAAFLRAKAGNRNWEWTWSGYLTQLARRDPQAFVARGDELLALAPQDNSESGALLAELRARSAEETEREKARAWLEARRKTARPMEAGSVTGLLQMARVAEALQAGGGAQWVDFAAQIAAQMSDAARATGASTWGRTVAPLGEAAFDNLISEWKAGAQLNALMGAVTFYTEAKQLAPARAMLTRMETLLPAAQAASDAVRVEGYVQKPKDIVAQARGQVARLLAETDPAGALELSKNVAEYDQTNLLLAIGKSAAKLGQNDLAARALRQVFEATYSNVEPGAAAAQIALGFDATLADELFQKAWDKSKPRGGADEDFGYQPSVAAYAGARAKNWPGESRILIEREWAERLKSYKAPEDNNYDQSAENLKALVAAMAKLDPRRALEMVEQLPDKGDSRAQARGQIAIALLEKP